MNLIQVIRRSPPVTTPEATLTRAARLMAAERAPLLPVVAQGRLVGTLSALDLVARTLGAGLDAERCTVRGVMRADPPACHPQDSLDSVCEQMHALKLAVLPVVDAGAALVGLVDLFDVEQARAVRVAAGPEPDMVRRVRGES